MGIESDQLVYDYLSRVGDLAQQQQLSSGARMRLVSELRGEIDRQRGKQSADSPAAVRRIIGKLGTPDELVAAAAASADGTDTADMADMAGPASPAGASDPVSATDATGTADTAGAAGPGRDEEPTEETRETGETGEMREAGETGTGPAVPRPRTSLNSPASLNPRTSPTSRTSLSPRTSFNPRASFKEALRKAGSGRAVPRSRAKEPDPGPGPDAESAIGSATGPVHSPPHRAGTDELGPSGSEPDWWRIESSPFGDGVDVPGFVGGVEIPAMLRPPSPKEAVPDPRAGADDAPDDEGAPDGDEAPDVGEAPPKRRRLPGLRRRTRDAPREEGTSGRGFSHPLLLLAAVLLVVGAALGNWLALAGGWLIAYSSRTLSRAEAKWAAMGLPGVVVAGAVIWLWGRTEGRWGEPVPQGGLGDALGGVWPVVVRTAALASAAFLVWRARRRVE
ncbi:hypothetical protein [Streptomyces sp. ML-6]|uniref:hypothetical protein n=1 Tax=Streptomyces sp. ML-6 TaxID=2982693 RepID=UPI0024C0936A|nr:hypothetical protein [Streptomyces sp. ML-6]MDK0521202.1 hypothetical protein [Streptomyces sp. ML-6]